MRFVTSERINNRMNAQGNHRTAAIAATIVACGVTLLVSGCSNPFFSQKDYLSRPITREELRHIDTLDLREQSKTPPVPVEQSAADVVA